MTWWRKLLGIPEPEDKKPVKESSYIMNVNLTPSTYQELKDTGWLESGAIKLDATNEAITITRITEAADLPDKEG